MKQTKLLKRILDYGLFGLVAIFIISLIFVPLNYFSLYGSWIIAIGGVVFVISIVLDLFYFAKETPSRKWGKDKKEDNRKIFGIKRKTFIFIIELIGVLILFFILLGFKKGSIGSAECPNIIEGNIDADFKIEYFYSPFCPHCWKEEQILRDMLDKHGDTFSLERYDIRYCDKEVDKYKVVGVPTFVFSKNDENKEFKQHTFISKEQLEKIILDRKKNNKDSE